MQASLCCPCCSSSACRITTLLMSGCLNGCSTGALRVPLAASPRPMPVASLPKATPLLKWTSIAVAALPALRAALMAAVPTRGTLAGHPPASLCGSTSTPHVMAHAQQSWYFAPEKALRCSVTMIRHWMRAPLPAPKSWPPQLSNGSSRSRASSVSRAGAAGTRSCRSSCTWPRARLGWSRSRNVRRGPRVPACAAQSRRQTTPLARSRSPTSCQSRRRTRGTIKCLAPEWAALSSRCQGHVRQGAWTGRCGGGCHNLRS
mmetsp:Transcript_47839/g.110848  ORF Transcript_47839/g.110848 Transcript_47839/m.110848 type:complete len:260 (-) Transcript_47839:164-943(-)